jgi:hypothetical protein
MKPPCHRLERTTRVATVVIPCAILPKLPPPPTGRSGWSWKAETDPGCYVHRSDWPRISIVTPSYNQAAFIEETIRSILLQNYPNLQYVVIDGGSTDGTVKILEKYSPWLDYWVSERDRGQSHAINKGLARCDGEWFNWINSDDCLLPGACKTVAEAGLTPNKRIAAGYLRMGVALGEPDRRSRVKLTQDLEDSIVNHQVCQPATFFKLDLIRELGGVREELHFTMDLDLWVRGLCRYGREIVLLTDQDVAFFREHGASKTASQVPGFQADEARVLGELAKSVEFPENLLSWIHEEGAGLSTWPVPAIEQSRMRACLWQRFVWGRVEKNWKDREISKFKESLRIYLGQRPAKLNPRQRFLRIIALLPDPLLKMLSVFRVRPAS